MSLSVIIIHAAPERKYRDVLLRTIRSILTQTYDGEVEIIVADDGSAWSQPLLKEGCALEVFDRERIQNSPDLADLYADIYILAETSDRYLKAPLWNRAVSLARHDKLLFLDDDHPLVSTRALSRYADLLDRYEFVFGRIRNPDGSYRRYRDLSVQGSNLAMRRELYERIGGFGEYTSEWGCGEDSDLFWKVYGELLPAKHGVKRAFFAGNILTNDLCTGRWLGCHGGVEKCCVGFEQLHGVHPHRNASRDKSTWVDRSASDLLPDFYARCVNFVVCQLKHRRTGR